VITTLLKKGLIENPRNEVIGVINRRNGCGSIVVAQRLRSRGLNYGQESGVDLFFEILI
jgi:hypothetical protein